jgi:geranylgeranyl pyrophosphate synthase
MRSVCLRGESSLSQPITFIDPVQDKIHTVEEMMRRQAEDYHPDLQAALDLLIKAGGKRVRPTITLLTGQMFGGPVDKMITLASAIELLHTATLVHDDLIDGSLLRRGMPTLNAHWSPGATILTGDFLFARAAKLAAMTESIPVMKLFSDTISIISNGEISQMFSSKCLASREDYFKRIYAKTASLFETSAQSAAILSPVGPQQVEAMRRYGYEIGIAFQIVDDVLDFTADPDVLGKPIGNDLRQGLITLPTLYYLEMHPASPTAQAIAEGRCPDEKLVNTVVETIRKSDIPQRCLFEARQYVERGLSALSECPPCIERQALQELALFFVQRDF